MNITLNLKPFLILDKADSAQERTAVWRNGHYGFAIPTLPFRFYTVGNRPTLCHSLALRDHYENEQVIFSFIPFGCGSKY
jgi:hypothetical protein